MNPVRTKNPKTQKIVIVRYILANSGPVGIVIIKNNDCDCRSTDVLAWWAKYPKMKIKLNI